MKIISLTGGIGSGKSAAAHILEEMGAAYLDADKVAHAIIAPQTPGWKEIIEVFGREILAEDLNIERKKLAQIVFSDPAALKRLNEITHPRVNQAIREAMERERAAGTEVMVIEVQIISGADWVGLTDEVWVVDAPREAKLRRLAQRGMPEEEALKRMASQQAVRATDYAKVVWIDNSGSITELRAQLEKLWQGLHNKG